MDARAGNIQVGARIADLRAQMGWSQSYLARRMNEAGWTNFYQVTVARTEKGERPVSLHEALALADLFGIDVTQLAGNQEPKAVHKAAGLHDAIHVLTEELKKRTLK